MSPINTALFEENRPKLLGLLYRMTGSLAEAEDLAQETFLKWLHADHQHIQTPGAWMVTVATRLALDYLKSARVQRMSYAGPWLPEPFLAESHTPEVQFQVDQSVTMALMVLLERLSPGERAAFILHDLFRFNFSDIGGILEKLTANCRKMASRAREGGERPRPIKKHNGRIWSNDQLLLEALKTGHLDRLVALLRENALFHSDGGGKAAAALKVIHGRDPVAAFLAEKVSPLFRRAKPGKVLYGEMWFNGAPGLVIWVRKKPVASFNFDLEGGKISKIYALRNPDKLRYFGEPPSHAFPVLEA